MRGLIQKSKAIYDQDKIQQRIERDTIMYLSKESALQEAIDDYKLILEYKKCIQDIVDKWHGKFTTIFTQNL